MTETADEIVFYTNPQSRGQTVRWMLEEVGRPYRTEESALFSRYQMEISA